jgi:hypothetical protein
MRAAEEKSTTLLRVVKFSLRVLSFVFLLLSSAKGAGLV